MQVFPFRPSPRMLLLFLNGIAFILLFMGGASRIEAGPARHASVPFAMQPTFFSAVNVTPRKYFVYDSRPGAVLQDSIHVMNTGLVKGTIHLCPVDATTSQTSGTSFLSCDSPQHDVGAWMTLSHTQITLNPGQSEEISFRLRLPNHVRPGQHGGGIIGEEMTQDQSSSLSSNRQTRIQLQSQLTLGVLINLPGTLSEKLNASGINYDQSNSYQGVVIALQNTGTQLLHPTGSLQIMDEQGQQVQNMSLTLNTFLPQTSINYPVFIHHHALNPGTYTAHLYLRYGHDHVVKYTGKFEVPLPDLKQNKAIPPVISDLVTPNADVFHALTFWHYIVGIFIFFLLSSALFFWSQKLHTWITNLRTKFYGKKYSDMRKD